MSYSGSSSRLDLSKLEPLDALETKYGADDAGKKKYVVGKWLGFKMVDGKPSMDQVHEFENLCTDVTNEGIKLEEIFLANVLLEKFPPSWSEYRNHLKHKKRNMPLQELISHMRTEETNRLKDKNNLSSTVFMFTIYSLPSSEHNLALARLGETSTSPAKNYPARAQLNSAR
ncbi:hypothetical protein LIER_04267 [Lithospermum erythrorhizon]|uniref:Uncharacterized protein n=1 Tax=Lithospermum erythrorhizon TaxID=34254 RepID=A0AAV3NXQ5_LITER